MQNFTPAPTRKRFAGWTADQQRQFLIHLASTGSVRDAAVSIGLSPRSAYRLRARTGGEDFARAWDMAIQQAGNRLLAHAFDRALHGTQRRVWKDGRLTIVESNPSDRLLMYLIDRIGPAPFRRPDRTQPLATHEELIEACATLKDNDIQSEILTMADFEADTEMPDGD